MANRPEDMSLRARLLFGGLTAGMGLFVLGIGAGAIPVEESSVHAPYWVIGTLGGMFTLAGLWILTAGTPVGDVLKHVVGPVILLGLLGILHWIAFGPGVRQCSGGFSVPFFSRGGPVSDLQCRWAFGYGALLFDGVIFGAMLSTWAERSLEGSWQAVVKKVGGAFVVIPLAPFLVILVAGTLLKAGWMKLRDATGLEPPTQAG